MRFWTRPGSAGSISDTRKPYQWAKPILGGKPPVSGTPGTKPK